MEFLKQTQVQGGDALSGWAPRVFLSIVHAVLSIFSVKYVRMYLQVRTKE